MRNVEFQEIGMENFGPYIEPMIYPIENNMLTLITGPNGIGKTMMLDALPYSLYGVTSKNAKGDDVVNNVIGKDCKTWVKFKINSDDYIVTRYHKYTKFANTVILNKNKIDIMKGHREVLPEIEKLLCPQKAFMNTLMFGQKVKDFFTDLLDSDKKEIFRKILNLEQYSVYYNQVEKKLKKIEKDIEDLISKINLNQKLHDDANDQILILKAIKIKYYDQIKKDIKELKISLEDNIRLLKSLKTSLKENENNNLDIESINKQLSDVEHSLKNSSNNLKTTIDNLNQQKQLKLLDIQSSAAKARSEFKDSNTAEINILTDQRSKIIQELNYKDNSITDDIYENSLQKAGVINSIESIKERINEISINVLDKEFSTCPTCEQEVSKETIQKLVDKINNYNIQINELNNHIIEYNKKDTILKNSLKLTKEEYEKQISDINKKIDLCKQKELIELEKIKNRIVAATNKIEEIVLVEIANTKQKINDETKDLDAKYKILINEKKSINELLEKNKKIENTIIIINQKIDSINESIKFKENQEYDETQLKSYIKKEIDLTQSIEIDTNKSNELSEEIKILQFWKSSFSSTGIPSMLIDESIPFMNHQISHYLDLLTNGRYLVSFDTLDENKAGNFKDKISVRVVDTYTKANSRVQLSGGQTRIIDIATILTLGDLQTTINDITFNILLFDEIFDALDYDNVGYVSKVLNKLKIGKSIFTISHQHQDQLEPDNLLNLK